MPKLADAIIEDSVPDSLPLTVAQYQVAAAKSARKDKAEMSRGDILYVTAMVNIIFSTGDRAEILKKRIFHKKEVSIEPVIIFADDLPDTPLLLNWILGLVGEVGELVKAILLGEKEEAVKKELGDVAWYLSQICTELGFDLEEVFKMNLAKLDARHNGEFTEHLD